MTDVDDLSAYFSSLGAFPRFTKRPMSIPGDLRLAWRLAVLCLLLQRGRANSLALEHLHVLWWAIRSDANRAMFLRWFDGNGRPDELLVRYDPSLSATLDLAIGQRLVSMSSAGSVNLTATGVALAVEVATQTDALASERAFLDRLPNRITQTKIKELLEWS